jgi:hypothetical protein
MLSVAQSHHGPGAVLGLLHTRVADSELEELRPAVESGTSGDEELHMVQRDALLIEAVGWLVMSTQEAQSEPAG